MRRLVVVRFLPVHLTMMEFREYELLYMVPEDQRIAHGKVIGSNNSSFTGLYNGKVIACAGLIPLNDYMFEAWQIFSEALPMGVPNRAWVEVFRAVERVVETAFEQGARRIQTVIDEDMKKPIEFAKKLGFEEEGRMRKYGPHGETFIRFARVG